MSKYTARFSGHQTFPLRYGWLYKYYKTNQFTDIKNYSTEDLMVEWGVGKNMVDAIKYWADRVGINEDSCEYSTIHNNDKYLDNISSIWLIHWLLCRPVNELTAYRIFFSFYNGLSVNKTSFSLFIKELFESRKFQSNTNKKNLLQLPSDNTLNSDISTLFLSYSENKSGKISEDSFSSPLSELGLVKQFDKQSYLCELEERTTLSDAVFLYSLIDYFDTNVEDTTISFDSFLIAEGSPARIFRMSQLEVESRIERVSELTSDKIGWTDTQGLRQIQIKDKTIFSDKDVFLSKVYK